MYTHGTTRPFPLISDGFLWPVIVQEERSEGRPVSNATLRGGGGGGGGVIARFEL